MTASIVTTVLIQQSSVERPTLTLDELRAFVAESAGTYGRAQITFKGLAESGTYVGEFEATTIIARSESFEKLTPA